MRWIFLDLTPNGYYGELTKMEWNRKQRRNRLNWKRGGSTMGIGRGRAGADAPDMNTR
jgi:hypothetical protein